jgi:hypothetical protein
MADHDTHDHTGVPGVGGSGSVATDTIWTTAGKVAVATGTHTATEQWPPGYEFTYVAVTSPVTISATSEAAANTVVTAGAVTFDGSTIVMVQFYCMAAPGATATSSIQFWLYDGGSSIGLIGYFQAATGQESSVKAEIRLTPSSASHTYSIRASRGVSNGLIDAGTGGAGQSPPTFIRITKV